jgi:beta-mannanase
MPRATRYVLLTVALALALVSGVKGFVPEPTSGASPARPATLFGLNVPSPAALDASESALGVRAAIVGTYADWAHAPDFPRGLARTINARGAVPLISWEPWDSWRGGSDQPAYALRRIAAGDHDALIDRWASQIATFHRPVMLRFAAEMNGDWLPWSTGVNGNADGDYVAAWRHVRARFRRAGAINAIWVWNPVTAYAGSTGLSTLFPGPRDVDWLAVDGFNWGDLRPWGWQSYTDVFAPTVSALRRLAPHRPLMIAETGSPPDARKPSWVAATLNAARADGLSALVWFEFDKETDWRLSASAAVAGSARDVLQTRAWRGGGDLAAVERAVSHPKG